MADNTWKLQDAKARFSEVVRCARSGEPQRVTVHGEEAVVVVDPKRFEVMAKPAEPKTMAEFIEASKQFRGLGFELPPRVKMPVVTRPVFDEDET